MDTVCFATIENSPAIYCREDDDSVSRPNGTAEKTVRVQPSRRDGCPFNAYTPG